MKNKISAFLGICNDVYVITVTANGKDTFQFNPVQMNGEDEFELRFDALENLVRSFKNMEIDFYADSDAFAFEWENTYKIEKKFDESTAYYERWNFVARNVEQNNLKLNIKGESQPLAVLNRRILSQ